MHKEVDKIKAKMLRNPWPKFVRSVTISGLRGWTGQKVRFEFPVCAIAGENGSGKSTVLKTIASLYNDPSEDKKKRFFPSSFFPTTAWDDVSDVDINYEIVQGDTVSSYAIYKRAERWRFQEQYPKREVIWQDISRTVPVDATVGYAKVAHSKAKELSSTSLSGKIVTYFSSIMGKSYRSARMGDNDRVPGKFIGIVDASGNEYSQFHQGAGEASSFDMLHLLQDVPDTSLILIDEIEASLHPRSQRRLMHFLLWIARTKNVQIIVSTHSRYILEELPEEGIIFLERTSGGPEILYGVTPDYALNRMDDFQTHSFYIFPEDSEAEIAARSILRQAKKDFSQIKFFIVGPSNIVSILGSIARKPNFPIKAIGLLDADQDKSEGCILLPGSSAPEREIIESIASKANLLASRIGKSEQDVVSALTNCMTLTDHHDWPIHFANTFGESGDFIWDNMCRVWADNCLSPDEIDKFCSEVEQELNITLNTY